MAQTKLVFSLRANDLGGGPIVFAWHPSDSLMAVVGGNRVLNIIDRQGKKLSEMPLTELGQVLKLEWDKDGECLAILQENLSFAIVWNYTTKSYTQIDVGQ